MIISNFRFRHVVITVMIATSFFILAIVNTLASTGTQSGALNQNSNRDEISKAPAKASAKLNPLEDDPDAPRAGQKLYEQHCAECHEPSEASRKKAPRLDVDTVRQSPPGALFWFITNGDVRRGMPVWSKLPEPQRWQIVSYLKSARQTQSH